MKKDLEQLFVLASKPESETGSLRRLAEVASRQDPSHLVSRLCQAYSEAGPHPDRDSEFLQALARFGADLGDPRGALTPGFRQAITHPQSPFAITAGPQALELWEVSSGARLALGPPRPSWDFAGFPDPRLPVYRCLRTRSEGLWVQDSEVSGRELGEVQISTPHRPRVLGIFEDVSRALLWQGEEILELSLPKAEVLAQRRSEWDSEDSRWMPVGAASIGSEGWLVEWVELDAKSFRRAQRRGLGAFRGARAARLSHFSSGRWAPLEVPASELAHGRSSRPRTAGVRAGESFLHLLSLRSAEERRITRFSLFDLQPQGGQTYPGPVHDSRGDTRLLDPAPVLVAPDTLWLQSGPWLTLLDLKTNQATPVSRDLSDPPSVLAPSRGGLVAIGPTRLEALDPLRGLPRNPSLVHSREITNLEVSPQGRWLLTTDRAGEVACWDLVDLGLVWKQDLGGRLGHPENSPFDPDLCLGFSPTGDFARVSTSKAAVCLESSSGELLRTWRSSEGTQWSAVALGPRGESLFTSELHAGCSKLGPRGEVLAHSKDREYLSHLQLLGPNAPLASLGNGGFRVRDPDSFQVMHQRDLPPDHADLRIWPSMVVDSKTERAYVVGPTGEIFGLDGQGEVALEEALAPDFEVQALAFASGSSRFAIQPWEEAAVWVGDRGRSELHRVEHPGLGFKPLFRMAPRGQELFLPWGALVKRVGIDAAALENSGVFPKGESRFG